jgi:predicted phosphodiesterase
MRIGLISDTHGMLRPEAIAFLRGSVISGHSHKPAVQRRDGILYVNPGSAGPRRFKLPISAAELIISEGSASARIVELDVAAAPR